MADDAPDVEPQDMSDMDDEEQTLEPTNLRNDTEVKATQCYYHLAIIAA